MAGFIFKLSFKITGGGLVIRPYGDFVQGLITSPPVNFILRLSNLTPGVYVGFWPIISKVA